MVIFEWQLHLGLLTDADWFFYFSSKVVDDLLAIRDSDIIKSVLGNFNDIVIDTFEMIFHEKPQRSNWVLFIAKWRYPSCWLAELQFDIFFEDEMFIFKFNLFILGVDSS